MNFRCMYYILLALSSFHCTAMEPENELVNQPFNTIDAFAEYCFEKLPEHRLVPCFFPTCITYEDICFLFTKFQNTFSTLSIQKTTSWYKESISQSINVDCDLSFNLDSLESPTIAEKQDDVVEPFIQKLYVAPNQTICFIGDLHGSIHALLRNLIRLKEINFIDNNWKIINPNNFLIFLGDFVDRGSYGIECWITLMLLLIHNPKNVILTRGNHEEYSQWKKDYLTEIKKNFNDKSIKIANMFTIFCKQLPYALFIISGKNNEMECVVQCSHGGINPQMDPVFFKTFINNISLEFAKIEGIFLEEPSLIKTSKKPKKQVHDGFIWSDFTGIDFTNARPTRTYNPKPKWLFQDETASCSISQDFSFWINLQDYDWLHNNLRNAGYLANIEDTRKYFSIYNLSACFRGHLDTENSLKFLIHNCDALVPWYMAESIIPKNYINLYYFKNTGLKMNQFIGNEKTLPVFTMSTATEPRNLPDEGFLLVDTNDEFSKWTIRPHIYSVKINMNHIDEYDESVNLLKVLYSQSKSSFDWTAWESAIPNDTHCLSSVCSFFWNLSLGCIPRIDRPIHA